MLHDDGKVIQKIRLPGGKEVTSLRRDVYERALAAAGEVLRKNKEARSIKTPEPS